MKKKLLLLLLHLSLFAFSQSDVNKVWDLLLKNDRVEARKYFDKKLSGKSQTDIDVMILEGNLLQEEGQIFFDESFVKRFISIAPDKAYIYPLFTFPFMINNMEDFGFDDATYKKADLLAESQYNTESSIQYLKIFSDHNRKDYEQYEKGLANMSYIPTWQLCGVFENLNGSGIDIEYEPEKYAKNDKLFDAVSRGNVGWFAPEHAVEKGVLFFHNETEYLPGIVYAQTFIESPIEQEVILEVVSGADFKVFMHDSEVLSTASKGINEYGTKYLKLKLYPGINRLLVKAEVLNQSFMIMASIYDLELKKKSDIKFSNQYQPYHEDTQYKAELITPIFEKYFSEKIKNNPEDITSKLLLLKGYLSIKNNSEAKKLLDELLLKYPKSSYLNIELIAYYKNIDDTQKQLEITKNIEVNDPDYFMNLFFKLTDTDIYSSISIPELEKYKEKSSHTKSQILEDFFSFIIAVKKSDYSNLSSFLDRLSKASNNNETFFAIFSNFYDIQKIDGKNSTKVLEDFLKTKDNYNIYSLLSSKYSAQNRMDDLKDLYQKMLVAFPEYGNSIRSSYISQLIVENNLTEAEQQTDLALKDFPYSATMLAKKGTILSNQKNKSEAEKYLKASLSHNSSNSEVAKLLENITSKNDEIDNVATKDLYAYIEKNRKTNVTGEKGVTILLDEYIENVSVDGGSKKRQTYIYKITSDKGIEEIKEYQIDGASNILKSEIVKENGSIIPAEQDWGYLVFPNLAVGDIVFIQYEGFYRSSGRFYKDFSFTNFFTTYYPVLEATFSVITPVDKDFKIKSFNTDIAPITKTIKDRKYTTWKLMNQPAMPEYEDYSPPFADISAIVKVNSLSSWSDISNWYADLVKKVTVSDDVTQKTFNEIFPKGIAGMSQEKVAEKIYSYIEENIKYSSVDFRQSGYIPQRPSKTIASKLGDCKDLSALFMVLANQAGLKTNMVLVSTTDNAKSTLALPAMEFNHCIVKTIVDGKEIFLELTDNTLPFKSISRGTYGAKALIIGDKTENAQSQIIDVLYPNSIYPASEISTVANVGEEAINFKSQQKVYGEEKGYYYSLFKNNTAEVRKNILEEGLGSRVDKVVKVVSDSLISGSNFSENPLEFTVNFSIAEKPQNVGSLKIIEIPFQTNPYTKSLVALDNRKTDIQYIEYENIKTYKDDLLMVFPEGSSVDEIPEDKETQYKNHSYKLSFEKVAPNQLKVTRQVNVSWDNITVAEYQDFKKYVEGIIYAEDQVVGYRLKK